MSTGHSPLNIYSSMTADLLQAQFVSKIILTVGALTYIACADPGSAHTSPAWACYRIDASIANTVVIKWADGNANFDNIPGLNGAGLAALIYS